MQPEAKSTDAEAKMSNRLKMFDNDLKKFGYTEGCQRCDAVRKGKPSKLEEFPIVKNVACIDTRLCARQGLRR